MHDRTIIVTGAATGIGEAIAILMAEEGGRVVVGDIDVAGGEATAEGIRADGGEAVFVRADVSREEDVDGLVRGAVDAFGGVDVLVNNAAVFVLKGVEATPQDWQRSLTVNVVGNALCTRYAAEEMKKRGGGAIVNLSSISGFIAQPQFVAYSATKAAILQMTRNVALDLAPYNIRVNAVCPGTILTQASHSHMERVGQSFGEWTAEQSASQLLGRVGDPREVAYPVVFLASDEASFITGTHLMVDGGYVAV